MSPSARRHPSVPLTLFALAGILLGGAQTRAAEPARTGGLQKYVPTAEELEAGYQRGQPFQNRARIYKDRITPHWFADGTRFWYRNDLRGGTREFILVDADAGKHGPAFDHQKLAAGLSKAAGKEYKGDRLPFDDIDFVNDSKAVRFKVEKTAWTCDLASYECSSTAAKPAPSPAASAPPPSDEVTARLESPWPDGIVIDPEERELPVALQQPRPRDPERPARSPDGKWTAFIKDSNVYLRGADDKEVQLSKDGKDALAYGMLTWSPDSKTLVTFRIDPGDRKEVYLIESSPTGGGRAKLQTRPYPLPGDKFTAYEMHLFDAATQKETKVEVDRIDFGTPRLRWNKDSHTFTYQKMDRGHQRFRLIEVDALTGKSRNHIDEKTETFIWSAHMDGLNLSIVSWLEKTDEVLHVSERDGWRHIYLIDAREGKIKNQITKGEYVVRGIERIDEEKRQLWFRASGKNAGQDPYLIHYYRVNFDGTGLVALTEGNGNHSIQYSPGRKYLIDSYSRVDMAPVHECRRVEDGKLVCKLEETDISELKESGWEPPEVLTAKGRDGKTDIWGIISRPRKLEPNRKYPVIEYIYAGPQGSFVPKTFSTARRFTALTELGFIVVQMDGMGTANRSKAFHDVCWHNLKEAGFPDRILWHQAVAKKYPYYDTTRVGIYGTSAGGQNSTGAVLFHGDFYKAAVSACGCHDNRMDKASWNEQWMGYPVGKHYAECSNIDNAHRLTGKLLLIVGELDTNVPPESTMRLVNALIKARKDFDLLVVPGMGHSDGGPYGNRRLQDFFVRHLHGVEPPDRNAAPRPAAEPAAPKPDTAPEALDLAALVGRPKSEAGPVVRRFDADLGSLTRAYSVPMSATRYSRLKKFCSDWLAALKALDWDKVSPAAREDLVALRTRVEGELKDLENRASEAAAVAPLVPFADTIVSLEESRRRMEPVGSLEAAGRLTGVAKQIERLRATVETALKNGELAPGQPATRKVVTRAADGVEVLRSTLKTWFGFYNGYDPVFTWWMAEPYKLADAALEGYGKFLREKAKTLPETDTTTERRDKTIADRPGESDVPDLRDLLSQPQSEMIGVIQRYQGDRGGRGRTDRDPARWLEALRAIGFEKLSRDSQVDYLLLKTHLEREVKRQELRGKDSSTRPAAPRDDSGISGRPIGREAVLAELAGEMVPYTPEELIALARQELEWCDAEIRKAAREMGFGDDWKKAIEKVKTLHVEPGQQPKLIRDLAVEAIDYLKKHDLVTVPPLAAETWRMQMMSPERQLVNPFFTGGEVITVSFPTSTMTHDAKLQSMRGNNVHFSRATVHHELIPGHHLQGFLNARYNPQRSQFSTAFWTEGWAVYWEMVLYDRGFPKTPEDRVGFLFWRMHRCARVMFSLGFHLGDMTPRQCIDLLVDRVGHEPENATAEVRRSFAGGYGPLYQCAYLIGAMQFRALRKDLVDTGKMPERAFHDAILRENHIPVEMVRAILTKQPLTRDFEPNRTFQKPRAAK